jgi:hypothetical protein
VDGPVGAAAQDPDAKLIPLRVERVDLHGGLWSPIIVPDVFGLRW